MRKQIFVPFYCLMLLCLTFSTLHAQQVFKTTSTSVIGYLEYLPQDYNTNSNKYPVMIFLHGLGERGANSTDPAVLQTTIQNVAKLGPPMYVKNGTQFPFILISPQLKNNYGDWPSTYVKEVIDYVKTYLRIDERRIYLTGLSLGGGGTWWTAQDYPELFAAIAPVCGSRNTLSKACLLASENLPVWAFHGDADGTVPLSRSVNMVNAINACTPTPDPLAKISIYPGVGHSAWVNAYKTDHTVHNPNVYEWITSFTNTINHGNSIPIANAGADKIINLPNGVTLTASATDSDGTISAYDWEQISGPSTVTLLNKLTQTATASSLVVGDYVFKLTVTDNSGNTDSDYIKVTVQVAVGNVAPVANAGTDKSITLPTNSVTITGIGTDSDGTIASFSWIKVSGGMATLSGTTSATLTATSMIAGAYVFRLTVTDNKGAKTSDDVTVTVIGNTLPVANAGVDKTITLPVNTVAITGSGTDSDGTIASYAWSKVSGNGGTLSGITTTTLTVTNMVAGGYVFRLTVTDNLGAIKSDDVSVTVIGNVVPVANAGADKTISFPVNSVTITGTGTDSDGTITAYAWSKVSGSSATLTGTTTSTLMASSLIAGTYIFRLTVTDNGGATKSDDVTVTVIGNVAPIANAGADKTISLPVNSVTITGTGTDSDGTISAYAWSKVSGGSATLAGSTTATLTASGLLAGSYVFRLTVTDNGGATKSDDITVTVLTNVVPMANAGADQNIKLPVNSATIVGSGTDSDGTITVYAWSQVSGATATLTGTASATLTATNLLAGVYVFRLTVTDNGGATQSDDVTVNVTVNAVPVANAGANQYITLPSTITLSGSGTDSDGTVVSYAWKKTKGGTATLTNDTSPNVVISNLVAGSYYFRLTVTDNNGATDYDDMLLTVTDPAVSAASVANESVSILSSTPTSSIASNLVASADEIPSGLGSITTAQLENSTVVIHDGSGARIYSGKWTSDSSREIFNHEGLYIYSIIKEGRKTDTGKIYIRD
jgi:dienelactone hydrolase